MPTTYLCSFLVLLFHVFPEFIGPKLKSGSIKLFAPRSWFFTAIVGFLELWLISLTNLSDALNPGFSSAEHSPFEAKVLS
jgi:hypothetical protein